MPLAINKFKFDDGNDCNINSEFILLYVIVLTTIAELLLLASSQVFS